MTTTVLIGTQGNKNVRVKTPQGDMILKSGHWLTLGIHGEQAIEVQEDGDFVNEPAGYIYALSSAPAAAAGPTVQPTGGGGHGEE